MVHERGSGGKTTMRFTRFSILAGLLAFAPHGAKAEFTADQSARMRTADIVILGEVHDNPAHHRGQAEIINRLAPRAVVFEMLSPQQARQVNQSPRDDLTQLAQAIGWNAAGWPDFDIYRPVFEALGDVPVAGAALPREAVRAAFDGGAAAVFGADAARFGLDEALPPAQQDMRETLQLNAHCAAMPLAMMGGMIEAQRLRDAQFAATALTALDQYGGPIVVITGNGHARRDWAVPFMIGLAAPDVQVFSVGFVEQPAQDNDPRFDATRITAPAPRPDPCINFKN